MERGVNLMVTLEEKPEYYPTPLGLIVRGKGLSVQNVVLYLAADIYKKVNESMKE